MMYDLPFTSKLNSFDEIEKEVRLCVLVKQIQTTEHLDGADYSEVWDDFANSKPISDEFQPYFSEMSANARILWEYSIHGKLPPWLGNDTSRAEQTFNDLLRLAACSFFPLSTDVGYEPNTVLLLLKAALIRFKFDDATGVRAPHFDDCPSLPGFDFKKGDTFTFDEVSILARMKQKSVRNAAHSTKPEGERLQTVKSKGRTLIHLDDLRNWLSNRRKFNFTETINS